MIKDLKAVYAGEQVQAAGILFIAHDTKNVLTVYRSPQVVDGNCWCSVGGKIESGETPEQAAVREAKEEIGYDGAVILEPAFVYEDAKLRFNNFIGLVRFQFFPELNWESDGYAWTTLENVPKPWHYGLVSLLADSHSSEAITRMMNAKVNS
jgi:8-oxo-dGTP pyrophosphatase MutT (NUDIX family)